MGETPRGRRGRRSGPPLSLGARRLKSEGGRREGQRNGTGHTSQGRERPSLPRLEPSENSDTEERRELRGGGVAGEPGGAGGGAPEPARGASKRGCTLEGRRRAESTARGGGLSRVACHNRSIDVSCSFIHTFSKCYWTPMREEIKETSPQRLQASLSLQLIGQNCPNALSYTEGTKSNEIPLSIFTLWCSKGDPASYKLHGCTISELGEGVSLLKYEEGKTGLLGKQSTVSSTKRLH
ncbi:uncharacterized protein LOC116641566 [Phoca vitulina]|uniref:uncharacterized protein LOC116641566 n=1 Tax=Phoca vitulina TaxID=9720 RepID=UPI001396031F|nr:uncharacterized protein LOC116641566 [Phoca vitulina]